MRQQFLPARLLCRVMRAGWAPMAPESSRLVRVFYPPLTAADERMELVSVNGNGTVAVVEWAEDELV